MDAWVIAGSYWLEPVQSLASALLEIVVLERSAACKTQRGRAASFPELPLKRCYHKNIVNRWPQEPLLLLNPGSCLSQGNRQQGRKGGVAQLLELRSLHGFPPICCTALVKSSPLLLGLLLAPKACRSPACVAPCGMGLLSIAVTCRVFSPIGSNSPVTGFPG